MRAAAGTTWRWPRRSWRNADPHGAETMTGSDGRDRPGLNLLIQLFGREVLDRLARAGYDDESTIAAAGPDRLASTSDVSLPLAQRHVAAVQDARASSAESTPMPRQALRRK